MVNPLSQKLNEITKEVADQNPDFYSNKKIVSNVVNLWVYSRLIFVIIQISFLITNSGFYQSKTIKASIFSMITTMFFSHMIRSFGAKSMVVLVLVGTFYSISEAYNPQIFLNFAYGDIFYNIAVVSFFIMILIQSIVMVFLLLDKNCKNYFTSSKTIQKKYSEFQKEYFKNQKKIKQMK